jgi:hypothetical protein
MPAAWRDAPFDGEHGEAFGLAVAYYAAVRARGVPEVRAELASDEWLAERHWHCRHHCE